MSFSNRSICRPGTEMFRRASLQWGLLVLAVFLLQVAPVNAQEFDWAR
jgi:hypothetical protein